MMLCNSSCITQEIADRIVLHQHSNVYVRLFQHEAIVSDIKVNFLLYDNDRTPGHFLVVNV